MNKLLKPGYVRWDGTKFITDPDIEIVGPQGSPGPTGLRGAIGPTGPKGAVGNPGVKGAQGFTGPQGPQGSNSGFTGPQGFTGAQGSQGLRGLQGSQGVQGLRGLQGSQGFTGAQGYLGNTGPQGYQGFQGNTGLQGYTGPQGLTGLQGNIGLQGPTGYTGPQGLTGLQGPTGDNRVAFTAELEPGMSVLDLVCISTTATTSIKVAQASSDDETKMPVVGVLVSKNSETEGVIVSSAIVELSGLTPGSTYFVGSSGSITNTVPTPYTGTVYVQPVGVALTQTQLLLNLSPSYIERIL